MSPRPLLAFTALIMLLSGCQHAAWKAGASADDLKRDEQACRLLAPTDEATTKQCLRDKGWTVSDDSAPPDLADVAPIAPATNASTAPTSIAPIAAPQPAATADPLQQQSIQTWWKAGAQAADFNTDANSCLEQLGAPHTPDYAQHLYTRAMASCLRSRGWFAGSNPTYTPLR